MPIPLPGRCPTGSACEPYFDFIELSLSKGRNAKAIYQDLVDSHGFTGRYASVKRFVGRLRGQSAKSACAVIVTPPAEEAQIDYGSGPMVRDPHSGRYRRTRLFVLTLGCSRKAVRLLTFQSSTHTWADYTNKRSAGWVAPVARSYSIISAKACSSRISTIRP